MLDIIRLVWIHLIFLYLATFPLVALFLGTVKVIMERIDAFRFYLICETTTNKKSQSTSVD